MQSNDLNYHHLRYFWAVARDGSVAAASERLHVAMPTISGQIKVLEKSIGQKLFRRAGRQLELTDTGRQVYNYADEIFGLGDDLIASLSGANTHKAMPFAVGVANVVPKLIAYQLIEPALSLEQPLEMAVYENEPDYLLADLSIHKLDLVISDAPIPPHVNVRAYNHQLGRSNIAIYALPALAKKLEKHFPESLDGAPFLAPTDKSVMAGDLDRWFSQHEIRPDIIGRFENSALMKVFASQGHGCFAAPVAVAGHLQKQFNCVQVGRIDGIVDRYFAISVERRLKNPAIKAICDAARQSLDD